MNAHRSPAILVAVGHDSTPAGLAFAAQEALLTGAPLHLAHVVHFPGVEPYAGLYDDVLADADTLLAAATTRVEQLSDHAVTVHAERIDRGALVPDLVERAAQSRMVVLEHRRVGALRRFVTGSTTKGVAARAGVPVIAVPEDWTGDADPTGQVTVAVQDSTEATPLLLIACGEASLRSARLTVLHACWIDSASGMQVAADASERSRHEARVRDHLAPALETCALEFPEVELTLSIVFLPPAEALIEEASRSDLLVMGRRHHLMPWGSHLGPVARTVLDHSTCPVVLAPEQHTHDSSVRSRLTALTI